MGKAIKSVVGGTKDLVLGKKDPGVQAQQINMLSPEAQRASNLALGQYEGLLRDPSKGVDAQIAAQEDAARAAAEDRQRMAKQMIAQRGLGNTSFGLNQILGANTGLANQIGAIRAQRPLLERENLQAATQGLSSIIGAQTGGQVYNQGRESMGRRGGLAPLLGLGAGYAIGGVGGAQVGMGAGQALTQLG